MSGPVYSDRRCPACDTLVPAMGFGMHIVAHLEGDGFPGGALAAFEVLIDSLRTSIGEAEGHPDDLMLLRLSLTGTKALARELRKTGSR